jgi:hypothetical protein
MDKSQNYMALDLELNTDTDGRLRNFYKGFISTFKKLNHKQNFQYSFELT